MAAVKKPRGRVWENRETMLLLQKWGDENIQTKLLSCTRKKPVWQEISVFLRAAGHEDRDKDSCKTRIHTLASAYRAYKDECGKTGNGNPKKKPAFFDEVNEFLSGKPCTKPKVVINSFKLSSKMVQRTLKKPKEMSKTLCQTCLPTAATTTTTKPANARNQKRMLV